MPTVLHVLTQRPGRTGSGVTLDALVRETRAASGFRQHVLIGAPVDDDRPDVGGLEAESVEAVRFGPGGDLPFPVPGMSDVMPYPSSVFGTLSDQELESYQDVWKRRVADAARRSGADLIHVHHIWLVGALVKDAAPGLPVVSHCHATGLRQAELVPRLAQRVRAGNARNDRFAVLHPEHRARLADTLGIAHDKIAIVGAGFREELFARDPLGPAPPPRHAQRVVFAGKLSASKGVHALLDAFERLRLGRPEAELHLAGGGSGEEADAIRARLSAMAPAVHHHGFVSDEELVALLRSAAVFALPSYYEGLPLVLVEGAAAGCRLVATTTPGVREVLAPHLGDTLHPVELPEMATVDVPRPDALQDFTVRLERALHQALDAGPPPTVDLSPFRWSAVASRVHALWDDALG